MDQRARARADRLQSQYARAQYVLLVDTEFQAYKNLSERGKWCLLPRMVLTRKDKEVTTRYKHLYNTRLHANRIEYCQPQKNAKDRYVDVDNEVYEEEPTELDLFHAVEQEVTLGEDSEYRDPTDPYLEVDDDDEFNPAAPAQFCTYTTLILLGFANTLTS